ncbi:hypothetical protein DL96DRAFT_1611340 [Flagelloscypha sp. PMI_526]|nr:hypothetical protein DL96DRAFT_1611340 [Flagelloscypha sp. PMI_526]
MRRALSTAASDDEPSSSAPKVQKAKRPKTNQACSSCRKHKTRCEVLDTAAIPYRCHRCRVLNVRCSYEEMEHPPGIPPDLPQPSRSPLPNLQTPAHPSTPNLSPTSLRMASGPRLGADGYSMRSEYFVQFWELVVSGQGASQDWSSPVSAMQQLSRPTTAASFAQLRVTLDTIVPADMLAHLLNLFDSYYTGWLNFTPPRSPTMPILDLVKCAVASRHLDTAPRNHIAPQLRTLTDQIVQQIILDPTQFESIETCQALLIVALWTPLTGTGTSHTRDTRVLISTAVTLAMNIRLHHSSATAASIPSSPQSPELSQAVYAMDRARLWLSLTNAESLLCLGTGRVPAAQRSSADLQLFRPPTAATYQYDSRDRRLRLSAELFDVYEHGISLSLRSLGAADVDVWYLAITQTLTLLDGLWQEISLPDDEVVHVQMLKSYYYACRLLVYYHAILEGRYACQLAGIQDHLAHLRPNNQPILSTWTKQLYRNAISFLRSVNTATPTSASLIAHFGTWPDHLFSVLCFASGSVLGVKRIISLSHTREQPTPDDSEQVLNDIASQLSQSAYTFPGDHPVHHSLQLLDVMMSSWQNSRQAPSQPSSTTMIPPYGMPGVGYGSQHPSYVPVAGDLESTLYFDPDSWSFSESPSSSSPPSPGPFASSSTS